MALRSVRIYITCFRVFGKQKVQAANEKANENKNKSLQTQRLWLYTKFTQAKMYEHQQLI